MKTFTVATRADCFSLLFRRRGERDAFLSMNWLCFSSNCQRQTWLSSCFDQRPCTYEDTDVLWSGFSWVCLHRWIAHTRFNDYLNVWVDLCVEIKVALGVNGQMRTEAAVGSSAFFLWWFFWGGSDSSPARSHIPCSPAALKVLLFVFSFFFLSLKNI